MLNSVALKPSVVFVYVHWPSFAEMPQVHSTKVILKTGCNYKGFLCLPTAFWDQCNYHYMWIL